MHGARNLAALAAMVCGLAGCSTSSSGFMLFPVSPKLLPQTVSLKRAHPAPVVLPRELNKSVTSALFLEPGDALVLTPADPNANLRLPGEQNVQIDGTVDLQQYGRVQVAYKTLAEIEEIVGAAVKAKEKKDVKVVASAPRRLPSKNVYVLGAVGSPNAYPLDGRETVLDAIQFAGGLTGAADHANIILVRPTGVCENRIVLPICYDEIVQWGDVSTNYQLQPGDRIFVPGLSMMQRLFGPGNPNKRACPPCGGCPRAASLPAEQCGTVGCAPGAVVPGTLSAPPAVPADAPSPPVVLPPVAPPVVPKSTAVVAPPAPLKVPAVARQGFGPESLAR
ncbi:MAG TPA: SLBB domain-containing protein [Planctomycetia bacterium]|nr:SLBB domain-containing protein [Planctomycetia bacterium]